jgi:hypothetical protein
MTNREIELILRLRDEVSKEYAKIHSDMEKRSKTFTESIKSNWMAISASAFAAYAVINKGWDIAELGAKAMQTEVAFDSTMQRIGVNAEDTFNKINKAAGGIIDDSDLKQIIIKATSMGVPVEKLGDLMLIARAKGREMNVGVSEAFSNITEAVGRANPRLLAHLGIVVKNKDLNSDFKGSLDDVGQGFGTVESRAQILKTVLEQGLPSVKSYNLNVLTAVERMQKLQADVSNMKETFGAITLRLGFFVSAAFQSFEAIVQAGATSIFAALALVEKGKNLILGTTDHFFSDKLMQSITTFNKLLKSGDADLKLMTASAKDLMGVAKVLPEVFKLGGEENIKLSKEQTTASKAFEGELVRINNQWARAEITAKQYYTTLREENKVAVKDIDATMKAIDAGIAEDLNYIQSLSQNTFNVVTTSLQEGFAAAFSGVAGAGKSFMKSLLGGFITMIEGMVVAAESAALAKAVVSWGTTLLSDLPMLAAAFAGLEGARAIVNRMHTGGTAYIDAPPNQEVPILLRGQETVRVTTPEQEGRGSGGLIININGPLTSKEAFKKIVQEGMRELGVTDVSDYFVNNRNLVSI